MALTVLAIRNLVSDPEDNPTLQDDAYQTILDTGETNAYRAAAVACNQLSAYYATKVDVKAGPVSVSNSQKAKAYLELSKKYNALADSGHGDIGDGVSEAGYFGILLSGVSLSEMDTVASDGDRFPSAFEMGLDDNPVPDVSEGE